MNSFIFLLNMNVNMFLNTFKCESEREWIQFLNERSEHTVYYNIY